jgi:Alpha-glutamyl/putrescinyl thymine pyrophosphorylase clade 2
MSHLSIEEFGAKLLSTQDLDPVYSALEGARLERPQLLRLCLAYWCFYHLGAAAKLSEQKGRKFWDTFMEAAVNAGEPKPWPRGAERRHFRGQQAISAVEELADRYALPEDAALGLTGSRDNATFLDVSEAAQSHRGFGPWIAFKIADMRERVLGLPTDFRNCTLGIYKDPRQGGALAFYERELAAQRVVGTYAKEPWTYPVNDADLAAVIQHYINHFKKYRAPPRGDRPVNVQEVETIFCKYKSHRKGHYPPGKDTLELHHALSNPHWGKTAAKLKEHLPVWPSNK